MSGTAQMDPKNLLMFAVLGFGAYYLMTRRAGASVNSPARAVRGFFQ